MRLEPITIQKIKPDFTIKAIIELGFGGMKQIRLSLNRLDLPSSNSKKGKALYAHLTKVFSVNRFYMAKIYGKDALYRFRTDLFYLPTNLDSKRQAGLPGEKENFERVVRQGRHLNQELLDLGLAKPYDVQKHLIDFSKKKIKVGGADIELRKSNFKSEVCVYINECQQLLRAALERAPVNPDKLEFSPTDEEFLIIYGLKELKGLCMNARGLKPLNWKGN